MSSSNHNENSNTKRNISTVATGKDILALTKEFGDTINNGQTTPAKVTAPKRTAVIHEKNYTPTRELPLTKAEVKQTEKPKNVGPIYNYNTVENFKELFSYRKPILLEELEKAHRSLNDVNSPSSENLAQEEAIMQTPETLQAPDINHLDSELRVIPEEIKVIPEEVKIIPELQLEPRGGEEVKLRPIHESNLELESSNQVNSVYINKVDITKIDKVDLTDKVNEEVNEVNEINEEVNKVNEEVYVEEFEEFNESINEPFYEEVATVVTTPEPAYGSTQAILAQQRIRELKEKSSSTEVTNPSITQATSHANHNKSMQSQHNQETAGPKKTYLLPAWSLLKEPPRVHQEGDSEDALAQALLLEETLANFGVKAQVTNFSEGPTITRFEIQPAPGVKVSRIVNLADDIALCLAAGNVRIEAPIPGKSAVGIEVPNSRNQAVYLKDVIADGSFVHGPSKLLVALGKDISGKPTMADLTKMPHLLIAGSTGSGKSVCMNSIITSILYRANPDEVKFLMVDPKMVELSVYNGIPHLIAPVIIDPKKATAALKWVVNEMENRYNLFAANGVRNLEGYNKGLVAQGEKPLPLVVVLIDELADLMMVASRDVEESICRLAQKARAAGIHLVIATQRPSVDVITGIIKANIPSRIAFAVSSQIDSRTILDLSGAEKLLGRGDMLYSPIGTPKPVRVQGVFVSDEEVEKVVGYWKQQGKPEYEEGVLLEVEGSANNNPTSGEDDDELLPDATKLVVQAGQASVSLLQRRFRIGYTRAARLIDLMEERGIVGGYEGSKPRSVLISLEDWEIENGIAEN